jgi:hypothetical protein
MAQDNGMHLWWYLPHSVARRVAGVLAMPAFQNCSWPRFEQTVVTLVVCLPSIDDAKEA